MQSAYTGSAGADRVLQKARRVQLRRHLGVGILLAADVWRHARGGEAAAQGCGYLAELIRDPGGPPLRFIPSMLSAVLSLAGARIEGVHLLRRCSAPAASCSRRW
jgi:hypothetical protein